MPSKNKKRNKKQKASTPTTEGGPERGSELVVPDARARQHERGSSQVRDVAPEGGPSTSRDTAGPFAMHAESIQEKEATQEQDPGTEEDAPHLPPSPPPEDPADARLNKMRFSTDEIAKRPGFGKTGFAVMLISNYYKMDVQTDSVYHYDVNITFLRERKKTEAELKSGVPKGTHAAAGVQFKAGKSLMEEGSTAKEDSKRHVTHLQHGQKRVPGKKICRKVIAEMIKLKSWESKNPVYDGQKNIYSTKTLGIEKEEKITVTLDEVYSFADFEVKIQPVEKSYGSANSINLEQMWQVLQGYSNELIQEVLMVFDTMLGHREPPFTQVQVGRSFFKINQEPYTSLALRGLEIWSGYKQSVRLAQRDPVVIVDFAAKLFHMAGPMIKYASKILNVDVTKPSANVCRMAELLTKRMKQLKFVRQVPKHMKQPLTVCKVTNKSADEIRFKFKGKDTTVAEYYNERYGYRLKYKHLPCVQVQSKADIPMEICIICEHQPYLIRRSDNLDPPIQREMIKETAVRPNDRFSKIREAVKEINEVSGKFMKKFGVSMVMNPMNVPARVLTLPKIQYNEKPPDVDPDAKTGKWNMKGYSFWRPFAIDSWVLFSFARREEIDLNNLAQTLSNCARQYGITLPRVRAIQSFGQRDTVQEVLRSAKERYNANLAVVVFSESDPYHTYEEIKYFGDIILRLVTQCITEKVAKGFSWTTANTLLPKLNTKLGGANHTLRNKHPIFSKPIILFGADATHFLNRPSIAALAGSLDAYPSKYAVTCRVQENPKDGKISQEIILDLEDMCKTLLRRFMNAVRNLLPERIIFFRDGVSEGQYETVLREEIPRIRQACNEVMTGYKPPITYIIVQRTHMSRFKPVDYKMATKNGNMLPGTVIDRDVTHPIFYDFFICSHEGIQGTSKAAHYMVLLDENRFSVDDLQKLCYHLCFTYSRCNRSIAVPPPVRYADLACTRARAYADHFIKNDASSTASGEQHYPPEVVSAINRQMGTFDETMFYI